MKNNRMLESYRQANNKFARENETLRLRIAELERNNEIMAGQLLEKTSAQKMVDELTETDENEIIDRVRKEFGAADLSKLIARLKCEE